MKKVKCVCNLYMYTTIDKVYDVVEYDSKNMIKIYDDNNILSELRVIYPLNEGEVIIIFQDVTEELRNETITEILS